MSNVDSDEDQDDNNALNKQLTGFLFGNIDEEGKLESDFLDEDVKKHVGSLSKYIIENFIMFAHPVKKLIITIFTF
jgi:transcription initiation factor TFIID subunit 1